MAARVTLYDRSVFINCPFSTDYQPVFRAILFDVFACGYRPRCAFEVSDGTENRLSRIEAIIRECRLGIHDISFMGVDGTTGLARMNMPFELGLFLGAKRFGSGRQGRKAALVLDSKAYRYRAALSDISGQDICVHKGTPRRAIGEVRDWLNSFDQAPPNIPGGHHIAGRYAAFARQLPAAAQKQKLDVKELTYADICRAMESWLKENF
jgi:hypothetical protein